MCRAALDVLFGWFGEGIHGSTVAMFNEKGRRYYVTKEIVGISTKTVMFGACLYFFGF
jgi:hypothetical protein